MEHKILKQKKLDKELNLRISEDVYMSRLYVEFYSEDRKLVLQRSFQNTLAGKQESSEFSKTIKNIEDLKNKLAYPKGNKVQL